MFPNAVILPPLHYRDRVWIVRSLRINYTRLGGSEDARIVVITANARIILLLLMMMMRRPQDARANRITQLHIILTN